MAAQLPALIDLHQVFNPTIAPPKLANRNSVAATTAQAQSGGTQFKLKLLGRKDSVSTSPVISAPTNFRHIVHVSGTTIELLGESESAKTKDNELEIVQLNRNESGFGMHLKTLDSGRTIISLLPEGGAALATGRLFINDEIVMVDGERIQGLKHDEVVNKLRGKTSVLLHIAKYKEVEGAKPAVPPKAPPPTTCRVCGKPASFNCSACGVDIMYCSTQCQKTDWSKHKTECLVMKKDVEKPGPSAPAKPSTPTTAAASSTTAVPLTGACRVCRDKNARYRCSCGGSMYCSQKCQAADWPSHKFHCTSPLANKERALSDKNAASPVVTTTGLVDLSFYVALDRHVLKMSFNNGVFEYLWTTELSTVELSDMTSYPTLYVSGSSVFVSAMSFLYRLEAETGRLVWSCNLGYPFEGDAIVLEIVEDTLLLAAGAGQLVAVNQSDGVEVSRKLLSRTFEPVTLIKESNIVIAIAGDDAFGMAVVNSAKSASGTKDPISLLWRTPLSIKTENICASLCFTRPPENGNEVDIDDLQLVVATDHLAVLDLGDGSINDKPDCCDFGKTIKGLHSVCLLATTTAVICWQISTGTLISLDPQSWEENWSQKMDDCVDREATLLKNEIVTTGEQSKSHHVVYVGVFMSIIAVDIENGEVLWIAKLVNAKTDDKHAGIVSMMRIQDTLVAATTGRVYALSANSGNPLRKAQLPQNADPKRFVAVSTSRNPIINTSCPPGQIAIYRRE